MSSPRLIAGWGGGPALQDLERCCDAADCCFPIDAVDLGNEANKLALLYRADESRRDFQARLFRRTTFNSDIQQAMIRIYFVSTPRRRIDEYATVPCPDPLIPGLSRFASLFAPIDPVLALCALGAQVPSVDLLRD